MNKYCQICGKKEKYIIENMYLIPIYVFDLLKEEIEKMPITQEERERKEENRNAYGN